METRANYALIGAFVIAAVLAVAAFVLWLGQSQFRQDFENYDIVFEGPVNLEEGASVRYIGIKVGEVSWVRIDREDASKVRARIRVDSETPVKTDSTASIQLAGITGVTFIQITAGSANAPTLRARPGQPVPVIKAERTQLDEIVASGAEVLGKASLAIERINSVLSDENITSVENSIRNVEMITQNLASNDGLVGQASTTMKDISAAADRVEAAAASVQKLGDDTNQQVAEIGTQLEDLIDEVSEVATNTNKTVEESGRAVTAAADAIEGPAVLALNDARIATRDLRILISRLDKVARELEQNPQGFVVGDPVPYEEKR
ncbi:MlaD family protein [Hyphomonas pacifica]|uniref:Mce/MlaD domain-containing protein n=1 Tax=Hyphomonas pacifica TaxID=1280941 RepID=A0A062U9C9_9PROT|nr:MlaD family protein [Hyphomonas pacifica]KCZ52740.1 hypothetical protein HY2_07355 [Hyphomonas pacifica]RAN32345.1 hypothetical protein HY3_03190 [Hyphomonas pacifica]RAN33772.1 hypothetical protein HY11_03505 [Hyphomonas pacifica]